jgi:adenine-specific DNA-methyltransferase
MREELERAFADNNDDYGRKLYLIENCLYGVDIQPIAIQITKLRFFISLVCDQKTNRNKKDNHGIRPLPNLETKFVFRSSRRTDFCDSIALQLYAVSCFARPAFGH